MAAPAVYSYMTRKKGVVRENVYHLQAAVNWLMVAQERSDNTGYGHSFHLLYGWQPPYPETTGYIIPSLLSANRLLKDEKIGLSVGNAVDWLLKIQNTDGSFSDLRGTPQVFDTGQILIGLNYLFENNPEYDVKDALLASVKWLSRVQDKNGAFIKNSYNNRPHTYYSRVGAAMIKAGQLLSDDDIRAAGARNIDWVISQQKENGFFYHLSFDEQPPFLHTMIYVIEGLLDAYVAENDIRYYDSARKFMDRLLKQSARDRILRSQYDDEYGVRNKHICVTGLAQWSGICSRFYKLDGNHSCKMEAVKTLDFLKQAQILSGSRNISGAFSGTIPVYGNYLRFSFPNWGVKFFIDALIEAQ